MDDKTVEDIISFINKKYDEEVPGPVKFVIRRKAKKIKNLDLDRLPESLRQCTVEELLLILKDAHDKKLLKF